MCFTFFCGIISSDQERRSKQCIFKKENVNENLTTLQLDNDAMANLIYALVVAKSSSDYDLARFRDNEEIYGSEYKTNLAIQQMLKVLRSFD